MFIDDAIMAPDRESILTFLRDVIKEDIQLVAIKPDGGIIARWFGINHNDATNWAIAQNLDRKGLYWTVNISKPMDKKPSGGGSNMADMGDIVAHRFLHVDIDPPKDGADFDISAVCRNLDALEFSPSFIVASGGGVQAFWRLAERATDKAKVTAANKGLAKLVGGDNCHNHDRIMRLPGTINWPNRRKAGMGRKPALAKVL